MEKGVETVADGGILAGFPLIDYKVTIVDGLHHDVDECLGVWISSPDNVLKKPALKQH